MDRARHTLRSVWTTDEERTVDILGSNVGFYTVGQERARYLNSATTKGNVNLKSGD